MSDYKIETVGDLHGRGFEYLQVVHVAEIEAMEDKLTTAQAENESLRARVAELEKCVDDGSDAWLLRKQAEAVEAAYKSTVLSTKSDMPEYEKGFDDAMAQYDTQMANYVQRLHNQADELEQELTK